MQQMNYAAIDTQSRPLNRMNLELEAVNSELRQLMQRSRILLEEMTILLQWHDPEVNRRMGERRSGRDRRVDLAQRTAKADDVAVVVSTRRQKSVDRRLELQARQTLITSEMEVLGMRNVGLQQQRMALLGAA